MKKLSASSLKLGLILVFSTLLSATVTAQTVDYNYLDVRFVDDSAGRGGNANNGGDGIEIGGSYQINSDWLTFGSYRSQDYGSGDLETFEIGGGKILRGYTDYDHDLIATATIVNREFSYTGVGGYSDTGVRLSVGVRDFFFNKYLNHIEVLQAVELRGSVNVEHIGDFDAYLELGADYHFNPIFSAGLQLELGGDVEAISIGGRWYY